MTLRPARPADAPALAAVLSGWVAETPWMPRLHDAAEDMGFVAGLIAAQEVTVLESGRGAEGFLARDGDLVTALYLAPGARGQGHGRRLLDHAKAAAGRLRLWTFQANRRAIAFYRREGFAEVERTDGSGNAERLPDLCLVWPGPPEGETP